MSGRFAPISGRRNWKTVGKNSSGWMNTATRRVAQVDAVAATSGRFERLTTKAPGFAGGYLRVPGMPDSLEVRVLYPT